jgi:hypothetical protein
MKRVLRADTFDISLITKQISQQSLHQGFEHLQIIQGARKHHQRKAYKFPTNNTTAIHQKFTQRAMPLVKVHSWHEGMTEIRSEAAWMM